LSRETKSPILEQLRRYKELARRVKKIVNKIDPNAKVFVFGSVVRGRFTASSDIDILIVTDKDKTTRYKILVEVYSIIKGPIEIHFSTHNQFKNWYMRFIDKDEIEEID